MAEKIEFEASGFTSLKAQIREANIEYQALLASIDSTPESIAAAASKVANLKDQFNDANDAIGALTQQGKFQALTKGLAAVSGGFTAVQGAITLAGGDVKEFEQTFMKLQAAMALTQGLTALADVGDAFGAIKVAAVGAFNSIKAAIGSTGIGLLIIGIGIAVQQLMSYMDELSEAQKQNKVATEALSSAIQQQTLDYQSLNAAVQTQLTIDLANAELQKKSIEDVGKIRKKANQDQIDLLDEAANKRTSNYFDELALAQKSLGNGASYNAKYAELTKQKDAADYKSAQDRITLVAQGELIDIDVQKQQQARNEKAGQTSTARAAKNAADKARIEAAAEAARVKALDERIKAELGANESARAIRLANAESEGAAIQIKYENDLAALAEKHIQEQIAAAGNAEALLLIDQKYGDDQILLDKEVEKKFEEVEAEADDKAEAKRVADAEKADAQAKIDADKEVARRQQIQDLIVDSAQGLISDLKALNQNYDKDNEEAAKKAFDREKALSIASTLITTYVAAQKAYASQIIIGDPTSIVRGQIAAAVAVISGLARVAIISGQQFEPSGSSSSSSSSAAPAKSTPSTYAEGGLLTGNSHDLGGIRTSMGELEGGEFIMNRRATANFLPLLESINSLGNTNAAQVQVAAQQPIVKTYVVATDMSSQQEANARLNALARL